MSNIRYIARPRRGPRGGEHVARQLYSSLKSAQRNVVPQKGGQVLVVDLDELPVHGVDSFEHAESRMLHWTSETMRLRPDAPLMSVEWRALSKDDVERLARVTSGWRSLRSWLNDEADDSGDSLAPMHTMTDRILSDVLREVLAKLEVSPMTDALAAGKLGDK